MSERNWSDTSSIVLILIFLFTCCLIYRGDTLIKVPRYPGAFTEIRAPNNDQISVDDAADIRLLEGKTMTVVGQKDPNWKPPCLPEEDPALQALAVVDSPQAGAVEAIAALLRKIENNNNKNVVADVDDDVAVVEDE